MRILHTGDWHLGKLLGNHTRLPEQVTFIDELAAMIREQAVDLVVVAGDVFDTHNPSAHAEQLFYHALKKLTTARNTPVDEAAHLAAEPAGVDTVVPVVVVAGNHDNPVRLAASSPIALSNGALIIGHAEKQMPVGTYDGFAITRADKGCFEMALRGHRLSVAALPFPSPHLARSAAPTAGKGGRDANDTKESSPDESSAGESSAGESSAGESSAGESSADESDSYAETVARQMDKLAAFYRDDTVNIMVGHFFLVGGVATQDSERPLTVGGAYAVDGRRLPRQAQYVAMGHLHRAQTISGHPCAYYAGSPIQFSQNEAGYAKCVLLADIEPGCAPVVEKVYLRNYKPLEIWEADSIEAAIALVNARTDVHCWAALHIKTNRTLTPSEMRQIRTVRRDLIEIRPIMEPSYAPHRTAPEKNRTPTEMFTAFYREKKNAPPSEALTALFAALSRQAEDG